MNLNTVRLMIKSKQYSTDFVLEYLRAALQEIKELIREIEKQKGTERNH